MQNRTIQLVVLLRYPRGSFQCDRTPLQLRAVPAEYGDVVNERGSLLLNV